VANQTVPMKSRDTVTCTRERWRHRVFDIARCGVGMACVYQSIDNKLQTAAEAEPVQWASSRIW